MFSYAEETNNAAEETSPPAYQEETKETNVFNSGIISCESAILLQKYNRFDGCELEFKYKVLEVMERNGHKADPSCGEVYIDYVKDNIEEFEKLSSGEEHGWLFGGFHAEPVEGEENTYIIKINVDSIRNPYTDEDGGLAKGYSHQLEFNFDNTRIELLSAKANGEDIIINDLYGKGACVKETFIIGNILDYVGKEFTATFKTYKDFESIDDMKRYFNNESLCAWTDNWWRDPQFFGLMPGKINNGLELSLAECVDKNHFKIKVRVPELDPDSSDLHPDWEYNPKFPENVMTFVFDSQIAEIVDLTVNSEKTYNMYFKTNGGFNNSLMKKLIVKPGDEVKPVNISWDEEGNESYSDLNSNTLYRPCYQLTGFCTEKECPHKRDDDDQTAHICWAEYDENWNLCGTTPYIFNENNDIICYAQWRPVDLEIEISDLLGGSYDIENTELPVKLEGNILSDKKVSDCLSGQITPPEGKFLAGFGYMPENSDGTEKPELYYEPDDPISQIVKDIYGADLWDRLFVPIWAEPNETIGNTAQLQKYRKSDIIKIWKDK